MSASQGPVPIGPYFTGGGIPTAVQVQQPPSHGTATAAGITLSYQPAPGFQGTDTFTYTATNSNGTSQPATVTVTVTP
jgi:hypothetical protein